MHDKRFTPEEMEILQKNPYVVSVTPIQITYSLAFRKFVMEQYNQGLRSTEIFRRAGFDPEMLGKGRIYAALQTIRKESLSPQGLHEPHGKSREERLAASAKEDLAKKRTKTAIRELQDRVNHLEQQVEFLKKMQSLKQKPH